MDFFQNLKFELDDSGNAEDFIYFDANGVLDLENNTHANRNALLDKRFIDFTYCQGPMTIYQTSKALYSWTCKVVRGSVTGLLIFLKSS